MANTTYLTPITALVLYTLSLTGLQGPVSDMSGLSSETARMSTEHSVLDNKGSSNSIEKKDLKKVKKPVRKFMDQNPDIENFTASCTGMDACSDFYYVAKSYQSDYSAEQVMQTLMKTKPQQLWVGRSRFQLSYEPQADQVFTLVDDAPLVSEDMIIALNLKILGLTSIPVVFKVLTIDEASGTLEFSYVEQNKNHGVQAVHVVDNPEGGSTILHETRYYSGKKFRDEKLYPWIHNKLTDAFYKNLETLASERFPASK